MIVRNVCVYMCYIVWYSSPPTNFRSNVSSEIFNHTHYCVTFFWLPPSDIDLTLINLRYNLTISSDESAIITLLDCEVLNFTHCIKYNKSYVVSLTSVFGYTIQSIPTLLDVFQTARKFKCTIFN